jgi:hypothetical protein
VPASALLWIREEQKHSGFYYQYSNYQLEYSRNLIFEIGHKMDGVFQALIDRSRTRLNLKMVKTILGYQHRPRYRKRKGWAAEWDVTVERPAYDLTIFKLHCGKLSLKIYTKGERVLRIEAVLHNSEELQCGRSLERFPSIVPVSSLNQCAGFAEVLIHSQPAQSNLLIELSEAVNKQPVLSQHPSDEEVSCTRSFISGCLPHFSFWPVVRTEIW